MATCKSDLKLQINIIATLDYISSKRISTPKPPSAAEFKMCGSVPKRCNVSAYVRSLDLQHVRFRSSLVLLGVINSLNPELNPICYLLALLGAHHFLHVSRIRVKLLTCRLLMSYIYIYIYIYMEHLFLMFLDHTQRRRTVGRTPLDE